VCVEVSGEVRASAGEEGPLQQLESRGKWRTAVHSGPLVIPVSLWLAEVRLNRVFRTSRSRLNGIGTIEEDF